MDDNTKSNLWKEYMYTGVHKEMTFEEYISIKSFDIVSKTEAKRLRTFIMPSLEEKTDMIWRLDLPVNDTGFKELSYSEKEWLNVIGKHPYFAEDFENL